MLEIFLVKGGFHNSKINLVFSVLKSEPMLDDLTELENTLNQTNDLSGFVTKLRLKFQQYSLANVWNPTFKNQIEI